LEKKNNVPADVSGSSTGRGLQLPAKKKSCVDAPGDRKEVRLHRAAKDRANASLNYHFPDTDISSDESLVGESGDDGESVGTDGQTIRKCDDDDTLDADDVLILEDDNDSTDDDEIMEAELPPPLRERIGLNVSHLKAASGRAWSTSSPSGMAGRKARENICLEGDFRIKNEVRVDSECELLLLFVGDLITEAVRFTNLHGKRTVNEWNSNHESKRHWVPVDACEMEAFIGLHILAGAFKGQYSSTEDLWSERDGHPVFRATMSRKRFCAIKTAMRFDDPLRRDRTDPLAPIRNVFETFNAKLRRFVVAGPFLVVDEQLLEFHGRVLFKQYIASKPGKFGIKIFWVCDASTSYCLCGLVYIGKMSVDASFQANSSSVAEAIVMQLCSPFLNKGRNITADNWFSSLPLVERLRELGTTYVGTIRANKRDLPPACMAMKDRKRGDTQFFYSDGILLCSFWDKGSKPVLLVDSFAKVGGNAQAGVKPETVKFYNETKSGVDSMDHMNRVFSAKRKCRRWPYTVAMNLVDIAGVNASIIYRHMNPALSVREKSHMHLKFLKAAGYQLVDAHIRRRMATQCLTGPILIAMQLLGYEPIAKQPDEKMKPHTLTKQARCAFCPRENDRKVRVCCGCCSKPMCTDHRAFVCVACSEQ
jgi:hypothetical protein